MKKARLIFILILALGLCGCGRNQVVTSVEAVIDAIGVVTPASREAVAAARTAYDILPEKLRTRVANAGALADAEAALTRMDEEAARLEAETLAARAEMARQLAGPWACLEPVLGGFDRGFRETLDCAARCGITFFEDGTCRSGDLFTDWTWDGSTLSAGGRSFTLHDTLSCPVLTDEDGSMYVPQTDLDRMFVAVELTDENVENYIEPVDIDYVELLTVGERPLRGHWIWLASRVCDDGLIYFDSHDPAMEVGRPGTDLDWDIHDLKPFGPMWNFYNDYMGQRIFAKDCAIGRARGTVYFVRSDYADITVADDMRILHILGREADPGFLPYYGPQDPAYLYY